MHIISVRLVENNNKVHGHEEKRAFLLPNVLKHVYSGEASTPLQRMIRFLNFKLTITISFRFFIFKKYSLLLIIYNILFFFFFKNSFHYKCHAATLGYRGVHGLGWIRLENFFDLIQKFGLVGWVTQPNPKLSTTQPHLVIEVYMV